MVWNPGVMLPTLNCLSENHPCKKKIIHAKTLVIGAYDYVTQKFVVRKQM